MNQWWNIHVTHKNEQMKIGGVQAKDIEEAWIMVESRFDEYVPEGSLVTVSLGESPL